MMGCIVQLKNDVSGIDQLFNCVYEYYTNSNREIQFLSSGQIGKGGDEGDCYFVNFILDRKYIFRYSIPIAIRTLAGLWIGVGPEYVSIGWLVHEKFYEQFSGNSTTEAVEHNLKLLDEYFALQNCCTCCKCQQNTIK
jgi:hypothetical protein